MQSTSSKYKSEVHDPKQGTTLGQGISDQVHDGLQEANLMVAVTTQSNIGMQDNTNVVGTIMKAQ